jgi:hypothetical protein
MEKRNWRLVYIEVPGERPSRGFDVHDPNDSPKTAFRKRPGLKRVLDHSNKNWNTRIISVRLSALDGGA